MERMFELAGSGLAVITDDGQEVSYAELKARTEALAARMRARSLAFCLCSNTLDSLIGYVACLNHGVVPLMLDARIDAALLRRFLDIYDPDYVWRPSAGGAYELEARESRRNFGLHPDLALLLTTSGSTGSPKLVRQSYANIRANTASIVEYLKLDAAERPITTLRMNYT